MITAEANERLTRLGPARPPIVEIMQNIEELAGSPSPD